jgi:hypothetical protein
MTPENIPINVPITLCNKDTLVCVCVFITAGPSTKLFLWGGGDIGGHVLRETTSRGLCGLVCPSRTSERLPIAHK